MNGGVRHSVQRARRAALKVDTVELLDRIIARMGNDMPDRLRIEIAELRMRHAPPKGVKAPIVHTGYSRRKP